MKKKDSKIHRVAAANLPSEFGSFKIFVYQEVSQKVSEHTALVMGEVVKSEEPVLVRIHSSCLTGDVFSSMRCDCRKQLLLAMQKIAGVGKGVVIYLDQEGRGIGLQNKIRAYTLQDQGLDTVAANVHLGFAPDERDYEVAAEILKDLGVNQIRLLTNNPQKVKELIANGIQITKREPLEVGPNEINRKYLSAKKQRLGHYLSL